MRSELQDQIRHELALRAGREVGAEVVFSCLNPAGHQHGDAHPSARWNPGKGVYCCDACGIGGHETELAGLLGISKPAKAGREPVATYDYRDDNGLLLYQTVRFEPKDFRQRRPLPGGDWEWKLNGVPRVPYRLPELLAAADTEPIYVVEGEKDADRLVRAGLQATTNAGGAGKWQPGFAKFLAGRDVVVLPDADEPGRRHAGAVAASLHGTVRSVRLLELPGLREKGDVSDWLSAGGTIQELSQMANAAALWSPSAPILSSGLGVGTLTNQILRFETAADASFTSVTVPWVVSRWVAKGAITELTGKVKLSGKTTFCLAMSAAVVDGTDFLGQPTTCGAVVYLTEQPPSSFKVALARAGLLGNPRFHFLRRSAAFGVPWPEVMKQVTEYALRVGAVMVVVDTLAPFAGIEGDSENSAGAALSAMQPLQRLADADVGEPPIELRANANLALAGSEPPALDDLDVATDLERLVRNAACHDVGDLERRAPGTLKIEHDVRLRTEQRTSIRGGGNMRRRADDADCFALE